VTVLGQIYVTVSICGRESLITMGVRDLLGLLELFSSSLSPYAFISFFPLRLSPSCSSSSV
jgi:hypothetical protein